MATYDYTLPKWKQEGTAPSETLLENGFQAGDRPPASVFNYQWHQTNAAITELQEKLTAEETARKAVATTSANGLMSSSDKTKLNGVATGAEVNQNAFSNVVVGSTTIAADAKTDTLTLVAGSNVTLTPDATNDKVTIAATDTVYTHPTYTARTGKPTANQTPAFGGTATVSQITSDGTGHVTAATDRTIKIPDTLSNGTSTAGLIKTSSTVTSNSGYTACPVISGVPYYKDTNTTYTSLKNPNALKVQGNGTDSFSYDGSAAKTLNIKAGTNVSVSSDTSGNITIASTDTNTHYTTGITAGASGTTTNAVATNPYVKIKDDSTHRSQIRLVGSGATTVKSDASGNITISSTDTDTNTTYTLSDAAEATQRTVTLTGSDTSTSSINVVGEDRTGVTQNNYVADQLDSMGASGSAYRTGGDGAIVFNTYAAPVSNTSGTYPSGIEYGNAAIGAGSTVFGFANATFGMYAVAMGFGSSAAGNYAFAQGKAVTASANQAVFGSRNVTSAGPASDGDTTGSLLIVGNGALGSTSGGSNAFRVATNGSAYGVGSFKTSGADYAEYFEWADGNPENEDRRGYFVTLDGEKIRKATADDDYIVGIVSATPSVVGDVQSEQWQGRYLTDVFGEKIIEEEEVENEDGETVTVKKWVVNPDYDPDMKYVSREDRQEWDAVGMFGKLVTVDDGTCEVNGYCKVDNEGRATAAETGYRVLSRLDANHIKVLMK